MSDQIRDLQTRMSMMLGAGKSSITKDDGAIQTIQYSTALEVRDGTYRMTEFGFSSSLPPGSDVLIGYLGGNRSGAVVIASNHPGSRHVGLSPGESVVYNLWGMYIHLTEEGVVIEANNKDVIVNNADKVTVNAKTEVVLNTPLLKVSGDVIDHYESNPSTLKALRDSYNKHDHEVKNVESGNSSVTSEAIKETV
ncbi:phage baseplate assembly protein [Morganella psychrotolerans]|uniref:phage baseplate assembly protein domain-containing protein n=1 Tax=Morganella psychrotolerans TaxID=368603 RepID=UPI0039AEED6D